jgi:hypothetical protein
VKTGFVTFGPLNQALHRIAELEAENALLRKALRDIDRCLPTDESMDQAHEMIGAALARTPEQKP